MRKFFAGLAATLAVWGCMSAASASIIFDNNSTAQSVTATSANPTVSNTLAGPIAGVAPIFSNRELSATLTSVDGQVDAIIGSGLLQCNRTVTATGFCGVDYTLTSAVSFLSLEYGAVNDAAFGGAASVAFFRNNDLIGSQAIAVGSALYTTLLSGASFVAGDEFRMRLYGDIAVDEALRPIEGNRVSAPATFALLGVGMAGMVGFRRKSLAA